MIKRSVAVVVRGPEAGTFLVVKRPDDPGDPLAGVWGLPAVTLAHGEDERAAAVRVGRDKLGVELAPGVRLGEASADRGDYLLVLADYEATIIAGAPSVPQSDASVTQYVEWRYAADPAVLAEAADRGSLCARIFLEDNSKKRGGAGPTRGRERRLSGSRGRRAVSRGRAGREVPGSGRARLDHRRAHPLHARAAAGGGLGVLRRSRAADRPAVADHLPRGRADTGVDAAGVRGGGVHRAALPAQAGHGSVAQRVGGRLRRPDAGLPAQRHLLRRAVGRRRRPPRRSSRARGCSSATSRSAASTRTTRSSTRPGGCWPRRASRS